MDISSYRMMFEATPEEARQEIVTLLNGPAALFLAVLKAREEQLRVTPEMCPYDRDGRHVWRRTTCDGFVVWCAECGAQGFTTMERGTVLDVAFQVPNRGAPDRQQLPLFYNDREPRMDPER